MSIRVFSFLAALMIAANLPSWASATTLLSDDFSGSSLDTAKWTTATTWAGSPGDQGKASVSVADGHAVLTNRGHLVTKDQFDPDAIGGIAITGQWTFNGWDAFQILTRSDGIPGSGYGETQQGLEFNYWNSMVINARGGVSISDVTTSGTLTLNTNKTYNFSITDNGTKGISLTLTQADDTSNTETISAKLASDSTSYNYVVFHNREYEGAENIAYLDNVVISTIPEPGTIVMTVIGIAGLIAYAWRKRRQA